VGSGRPAVGRRWWSPHGQGDDLGDRRGSGRLDPGVLDAHRDQDQTGVDGHTDGHRGGRRADGHLGQPVRVPGQGDGRRGEGAGRGARGGGGRDIAERVGITERAVQSIVGDLVDTGYLVRERSGRRNHYTSDPDGPLRHPLEDDHTVGELLTMLGRLAQP
jgi:hypothetical protein